MPVDPGAHTIVVSAPGHEPHTVTFKLLEGENKVVVLDAGDVAPIAQGTGVGKAAITPPWTTAEKIAVVAGGVGVLGVLIGTIAGTASIVKHNEATAGPCPVAGAPCHDQHGADLWESAHERGTISTVSFVVGGFALAGAGVLWWTSSTPPAPSAPPAAASVSPSVSNAARAGVGIAPALGPSGGGLVVRGGF
jgi:hypothetical protein